MPLLPQSLHLGAIELSDEAAVMRSIGLILHDDAHHPSSAHALLSRAISLVNSAGLSLTIWVLQKASPGSHTHSEPDPCCNQSCHKDCHKDSLRRLLTSPSPPREGTWSSAFSHTSRAHCCSFGHKGVAKPWVCLGHLPYPLMSYTLREITSSRSLPGHSGSCLRCLIRVTVDPYTQCVQVL
jgi:hypothetical protein